MPHSSRKCRSQYRAKGEQFFFGNGRRGPVAIFVQLAKFQNDVVPPATWCIPLRTRFAPPFIADVDLSLDFG